MDKFGGKCISGPYDGKEMVYPSQTMPVVWLEGNPLKEIPFKREGVYEFGDGIWRWRGPSYKPPRS